MYDDVYKGLPVPISWRKLNLSEPSPDIARQAALLAKINCGTHTREQPYHRRLLALSLSPPGEYWKMNETVTFVRITGRGFKSWLYEW